jgi:hypothetical protein
VGAADPAAWGVDPVLASGEERGEANGEGEAWRPQHGKGARQGCCGAGALRADSKEADGGGEGGVKGGGGGGDSSLKPCSHNFIKI